MTLASLTETLGKHFGIRKDGAAFLVPAETKLTLFVALTGETLAVPGVVRLEVADTILVADTQKGERLAFAAEDVRAVKADRTEAGGRERGAGFGK